MPPMVPFGLWPSPLSPRQMAAAARLSDVQWDSDGRWLVWLESRDGRSSLWAVEPATGDAPHELTPSDLSVRARVGYGGGDFTVGRGMVVFVEASSGRLFRQDLDGSPPRPITPAFGAAAAPAIDPEGRFLLFVHSYEGQDCIAVVDSEGKQWPQQLVAGHDFYMWPCWCHGSTQIAFVAWDHPNMPWDGTLLYLADLELDGALPRLVGSRLLAGGAEISIFQPSFAPDGRHLAYVSDQDGWWQIYLYDLVQATHRQFTSGEAEHATPAWAQSMRSFAWSHDSRRISYLRSAAGVRQIMSQSLDGEPAQLVEGSQSYGWFEQPTLSPRADTLALLASAPDLPTRLILTGEGAPRIIRRTTSDLPTTVRAAVAQPVSWGSGADRVHALLYLPPGFVVGEAFGPRPPAVILIHGGPTDQAVASYSGEVQFFATRGYTVLALNYRGSTGYGRAYTQALRGEWGRFDVDDAASAARYLSEAGFADAERIVIMGGSAGGYTVLESLAHYPALFRAGICRYGVVNLFALAAETHKFEARYLDALVGPLPEAAQRYRERSPIFHAERIMSPLAIFQGADDQIVPPSQAEAIVTELRRRGINHTYQLFPGEGHGWRRSETITAYYQVIERFLREHLIFV